MDANQQQPPLIKIKPDLDPFQVYGSNPEDQDDASLAIQSTRVKLAALRSKSSQIIFLKCHLTEPETRHLLKHDSKVYLCQKNS